MNTSIYKYTLGIVESAFIDYFSPITKIIKLTKNSIAKVRKTYDTNIPDEIVITCEQTDMSYAKEIEKSLTNRVLNKNISIRVMTVSAELQSIVSERKPFVQVIVLPKKRVGKNFTRLVKISQKQGINTFSIDRIDRRLNQRMYRRVHVLKDFTNNPSSTTDELIREMSSI